MEETVAVFIKEEPEEADIKPEPEHIVAESFTNQDDQYRYGKLLAV